MNLKNNIKRLYFKLSPTFRRTQYLLDSVSEIQTTIGGVHNTLDDNRKLLETCHASVSSIKLQMDKDIEGLQREVLALQETLSEYLKPQKNRFTNHYEYWRAKRITAIVDYYGETWFKGKRILELGCGYGDIGYTLSTLGATVVFAEGREENCAYLHRRFPNAKVYCMNCENEWPFPQNAHFDLILHLGLLYHLDNIWFALDKALECCDHLVLETEVADSDDPDYILKIDEDATFWDKSLMGRGSRPSAEYIEKHLAKMNWRYQRITDARCNALFHKYDWPVKNTGTWKAGQRRFWFCEK